MERVATGMPGEQGSARDAGIAILWVLAATAIFSGIFASGKLMDGAIPALQILFLRFASGFVVALGLAVRAGGLRACRSRRPLTHFGRACCGAFGGAAAIQAAAVMPIANATALGLSEGMLTVVFGILLLREHVSPLHWLASLVTVIGAAIVVLRGEALVLDSAYALGAALALAGAALMALENIFIRTLSLSDRPQTVLLYANAFGLLLMAGPAIALWQPPTPGQVLFMLALGPLAVTAQYCNIRGFRLAPASLLGPIGYSWVVFGALIGLLAFGEVPGLGTIAGSALIVAGGVALARLGIPRRAKKEED